MAVQQMVKPRKRKHNCTHWWVIDSNNVGVCKFCNEVRDFGELLQKNGVFVGAGQRGAKARQETLGKKRGRKKKKEELL